MLELLLNNNFLSSILAFALILIPAIIIHELGHFFAAKIIGVNVLEFGVGFPPRMMRLFMWGETEFTLNWLPIGGFVRPLGEDMIGPVGDDSDVPVHEDDDETYAEEKPKKSAYISERDELMVRGVPEEKLLSVNQAKPWPRIFFMAAGALANFVSAIFLFIIAALLGIPIEVGARVQIVDIPQGSVFDRAEVEEDDAIELINGEYFRTSEEFFATWQSLQGEDVTLTMRHADSEEGEPGEQYDITVQPEANSVRPYVLVVAVVEDAPAHLAGILPGDLISAINGESLTMPSGVAQVIAATQEYAGTNMMLTIIREGQTLDLVLVPRVTPTKEQGRIGIAIQEIFETNDNVRFTNANPQMELIPQPFDTAVQYGFARVWGTMKMMVSIPAQIIDGTISPEEARPVSIVGISQIGGQFLQRSIREGSPSLILEFLALISIFLGATNLLPFPPLDGGRIVFVLIEIVRGKPVPIHIENAVYRIGIVLLLGLGVVIIIYDLLNPISLG
ncbi:MAG: RIP metalloprotease RseP [Anaerolineae bacterium]|nr:RIP metalloprotease RseP [Anaerolineae bacterium]